MEKKDELTTRYYIPLGCVLYSFGSSETVVKSSKSQMSIPSVLSLG